MLKALVTLAPRVIDGFSNEIDEMKKDGIWKIEEFFKSNYIKNKGVNAWLCLVTVQK